AGPSMVAGHTAQIAIVGVKTLRRFSLRSLDLGLLQPRRNRAHYARGHLILQSEYVFDLTCEAVCPEMHTRRGIDELSGDAQAVARLAHATFQDIAHPQFAP